MARYKLKNSNNTVNCEILNESAGDYIVRFKNGVIQNVPKNRVSQLDMIDEAVLDNIKDTVNKYGRKFASKVRDVVNRINSLFIKGFMFFFNGEKPLHVTSPVNVLGAAVNGCDFINIIPGEDIIETCEENGINPDPVSNYKITGQYDGAFQAEWLNSVTKDNTLDEGIDLIDAFFLNEDEIILKDAESKRKKGVNYAKLTTKPDKGVAKGDDVKNLEDLTREDIVDKLMHHWEFVSDGIEPPLPLLIWGAPGIGKTAICKGIVDEIEANSGKKVSLITINASHITSDSFTMPASVDKKIPFNKKSQEELDDIRNAVHDGMKNKNMAEKIGLYAATTTVIKDLPKTWVPVYDPGDVDEDNGVTEEMLDDIANGAYYDQYGNKVREGNGGVIFIDEFVRMNEFGKAAIMDLPADRKIGNLQLGSKWLIVAAANRFQDMNIEGNPINMTIEMATMTRFTICNYVPTVDEWLSWGEGENKKLGGPNLIPEVRDYIRYDSQRATDGYGDYYQMFLIKDNSLDGTNGRACPRTWESISKELFMYTYKKGYTGVAVAIMDPDYKKFNQEFVRRLVSMGAGGEVADRFITFIISQIGTFTEQDAKNIIENGPNLGEDKDPKILGTLKSNTIKTSIDHMFIIFTKSIAGIKLSDSKMMNILMFFARCCSKFDKGNGKSFDSDAFKYAAAKMREWNSPNGLYDQIEVNGVPLRSHPYSVQYATIMSKQTAVYSDTVTLEIKNTNGEMETKEFPSKD